MVSKQSSKSQTVQALGLGESVATKLMKPLPENLSFQVTFGNLFTSLNLLQYLESKGIGATGTLRANRTAKCPITDQKEMAKKSCGRMDYRFNSANKIVITRWNNNTVVTLVSNCQTVNPIGKAKRYSKEERRIIEVDEPYAFRYYNQNMGRVDRMDQNITSYKITVRVKKWWIPLFMFMPDAAMQNALQASQAICKQVQTTRSVGFQMRSYQHLLPKILLSTTWGWLCWKPNSCCFRKACKST